MKKIKQWGIWIGVLAGAAFVVWFLHCFVFSSYLILSSDMGGTLLPGERIVVNKWSYGLRTPYMSLFGYVRWNEKPVAKGDVVAFNDPIDTKEPDIDLRKIYVYRCMAVPGDTLSVDNYRLIIPRKGRAIDVDNMNRTLYCNTLRLHEGKNAFVRHDTLFVNNEPVTYCVFSKNYYWMIADGAANISDSHLFGLVPEDHIIGKAELIWFSKDNRQGIFEGFRWNRFFNLVK